MFLVRVIVCPPDERLCDLQECSAVEELGERASGSRSSRPGERCEQRENCLRLGQCDVGALATEPRVPSKRGALEAARLRLSGAGTSGRRPSAAPALHTARPTLFGIHSRRLPSPPASASSNSPASWERPLSRSTAPTGTCYPTRSTGLRTALDSLAAQAREASVPGARPE